MVDNNLRRQYDSLVLDSRQGTIYCESWWLDLVTNHNWSLCYINKDNRMQAALPYTCKKNKLKMKYIETPPLTPMQGVLFSPTSTRYTTELSKQKEYIFQLINQLPAVSSVSISLHYSIKNWLPFYWRGFTESTHYTYVVKNIKDYDYILNEMRSNIRYDIQKAGKKLIIRNDLKISDFLNVYRKTFDRQNMKTPLTDSFLTNVIRTCIDKVRGKMFFACDSQDQIHAVAFMIWDNNCAYYLLGGADPTLRNSGAQSFLVWNAIKDVSDRVDIFDFEGSMVEPIERFVRGFGARQEPLMIVERSSRNFNFYRTCTSLIRDMI